MKISIENAEHYIWGNICDGWHLLKTDSLSIIQERMPPNTAEQRHFHTKAQQVFYVLSGTATFEVNDEILIIRTHESLHIAPNTIHKIANNSETDLSFIVISEPKAHGDRINL